MANDQAHLDYLYNAHRKSPPHQMDSIVVRIRDTGQPYGTGQGMKFSADTTGGDSERVTALDKLVNFISLTMDNTGDHIEI